MDLPSQFGPYTLMKKIASGGMAEIYLAKTGGIQGFEKLLVLKMIHPKWSRDTEFINMLVEEAKLAVQLNHNNIAQIFDLGRHQDTYYISMEYVDGKDLFQLLVRTSELESYLPFDVSAYLIEQAAAALHYAHSKTDPYGRNLNLIHRDVSPQNVIVSFNGEVKLIDFGIAKASMRDGHTQIGIIKGKFYYMSPEQAYARPLDHRTDIFSLGICLHEMLTGQMLYAEENQLKLLEMVRLANIPRPSRLRPGVPPELEAIAMRALEPDPTRRFQSAYEFQRALTEYLHRRAPGFTPNRCARLMWDLFPQDNPQARQAAGQKMERADFSQNAPPESVIFDLSSIGFSTPSAPPPQPQVAPPQAYHHEPTRPADDGPTLQPVPRGNDARGRRSSTRQVAAVEPPFPVEDDGVMTGDGLGAHYPVAPPLPAGGSELQFHESTQIVDWDRYKERYPNRPGQVPPQLPGAPLSFDEDGPTNLFDPTAFQAAPSPGPGQPMPMPPPLNEEDSGSTLPMSMDEATQFFTRRKEPEPAAPPPLPAPEPDAGRKRAPRPPRAEAAPPPPTPPPAAGAPAGPPATPMSREEKIAAAKARAKGGADLGDKVKKKRPTAEDEATVEGKAPSLEDKIAAAKAKAKGGAAPDLAQKARKKAPAAEAAEDGEGDAEDGGDDKLAAAKAKARARAKGAAAAPAAGAKRPNIVKGGGKGAAATPGAERVRVAGRSNTADPDSPAGKILAVVTNKWVAIGAAAVFIFGVFGIYAIYKIVSYASEPDVGGIEVNSVPPGAEIEFDGAPLGAQTPFLIPDVPVDTPHVVRVRLKNYQEQIKTGVTPKPGGTESLHFALQPTPGMLVITSEPSGADIFINGEPQGQTPGTLQGLARADGAFLRVELQKEGFKPLEVPLQWKPGEPQITHHAKLEKNK